MHGWLNMHRFISCQSINQPTNPAPPPGQDLPCKESAESEVSYALADDSLAVLMILIFGAASGGV